MRPTIARSTLRSIGALGVTLVTVLSLLSPVQAASGTPLESVPTDLCPDGDVRCVRATLGELERHTRSLVRDCDHNAAFAALYTIVTAYYEDTVTSDPDFFGDQAFVNREDAVFAQLYLRPMREWRDGDRAGVPPAWQVAFSAADDGSVNAMGDLVLGINAHVVRDLPFVLAALGLGSKADHDRVNDILRRAYEPALRAIDAHLDDSVDETNVDGTQIDDEAFFRLVTQWRERAWRDAQALVAAPTSGLRAQVAREIEGRAETQAEALLASYAVTSDDQRAREAHCAQNAWPPTWIGV